MRRLMTVGELAKLFNITNSKIRYYEKRGLLKHTDITDAGYSLYSFEDLEKLEIILLLRNMDVSIETTKELMEGYTRADYEELLISLENESLRKISELKRKVKMIRQRKDSLQAFMDQPIVVIELPKREYYILETREVEKQSEKEFFDFQNTYNLRLSNYKDKYCFHIDKGTITIMVSSNNSKLIDFPTMELPKGRYLQINKEINKQTTIEDTMNEMRNQIKKSEFRTIEPLLLVENYQQFLFSNITQYHTFIIRIDE